MTRPRAELLALLATAEFLISERTGTIDADLIAAAPNLRLIQRLGIQTWDIDLTAARAAGVAVCCWPIQGCVMVAEHMLLQILGVLKRVRESMKITAEAADWGIPPHRGDEDHFAYNWSKRGGIGMLSGATVGILGFGEIGLELAIRLRGFDCHLLYNKRSRLPAHIEERYGLHYATLEELVQQSDIVCSLLPYQGPQEPLNAAVFAQMKQGSYLVHCGSGAVVDEGALLDTLRCGPPGRGGARHVHIRAAAPRRSAARSRARSHEQPDPDAACGSRRRHGWRPRARAGL